jgi:hypothetical protein
MVQFIAHFDGHAITPDERVEIPVNVPLRVTIETATSATGTAQSQSESADSAGSPFPTLAERMRGFIGCLEGLPTDAALNHDHYLYGAPKKT